MNEWKDKMTRRLKHANESLEEANVLLREGMSARSIMNRLYYAIHYSVLALFLKKQIEIASHSGARNLFGRYFIKTGILEKGLSKVLHVAFDLRIKGDYNQTVDLQKGDVENMFPKVQDFVNKIEEYLLKKIQDNDIEANDIEDNDKA
ncbi:MAG: HEPN domain-containing protein [Cytophagales bacterium]|nr:HEPN domain-containing protein [Cytophagales bacterium]